MKWGKNVGRGRIELKELLIVTITPTNCRVAC